jgi:hypothetical protein
MADFRSLTWAGSTLATAQAGVPAGFTAGKVYEVKAAAIDNAAAPAALWVAVLDDTKNLRAVQLPTSGAGPFTFQ